MIRLPPDADVEHRDRERRIFSALCLIGLAFLLSASALFVGNGGTRSLLEYRNSKATISKALRDAPFSTNLVQIEQAITCPDAIASKNGGIVLLVHGTGSLGWESWEGGPYHSVLSMAGRSYDICWVDLPHRALGDAQTSAEYVAHSIRFLSSQSATGKVSIIGHSQGGGLNAQWALTFWPSIRELVTVYIALAADFKGTVEGAFMCSVGQLCDESIWQQTAGSAYLTAQNSRLDSDGGGQALVPTVSIFTLTDDVIYPELPPFEPTSYLKDHVSMLVDSAAFGLALLALEGDGEVDLANFDRTYCFFIRGASPLNSNKIVRRVRSALANVFTVGLRGHRTTSEPLLKPYVCERGYSEVCGD